MAEQETPPVKSDPATGDDKDATTDPPATDSLGDSGKKAIDAERKARRDAERRAKDVEAKLKEIEDRDKSDSEKLAEKLTAAEKRADDAERRALRSEVAHEKGLSAAQAKRLSGDTREDLEADADELLEVFQPTGGATPPPSNRPSPDLRGGSDPTDTDDGKVDPAKLADLIPRP
ncbi:MAG: hypothetical protein ACK5O2_00625 [Microthrixaceae bacterium]